MSLGNNIKMYRQSVSLSQEVVADRLEVSRQAVSKWETGQSAPSSAHLAQLAALFGVSISQLIEPENWQSAKQAEREKRASAYQNKRMLLSRLYGHIAVMAAFHELQAFLRAFLYGMLITGAVFIGITTIDYARKSSFQPVQILLWGCFLFSGFFLPLFIKDMASPMRLLSGTTACGACIALLYVFYWKKVWSYQTSDGRQQIV